MDDDADTDYIDSNYVWQQRIKRVLRDGDISTQFPSASALGVQFNPAFQRVEKIPPNLLTNGVILDVHDFVKAVKKTTCHQLFDVLQFNFDLGLSWDSPECFDFAQRLYAAVKHLHGQLRGRPKLQEMMQDVYVLPEVTAGNAEVASAGTKRRVWTEDVQLDDDRKGDPIFLKEGPGAPCELSMRNYPLCHGLGITFVLRSSNAPAQKLSTALLTTGMVLEMLKFAEFLGGRFFQTLKDLISHNFGDVYEPCYLSSQVRALHDKKLSHWGPDRGAFCLQPFEFTLIKRKKAKREAESVGKVEIVPEKRRSAMTHLSKDYYWEEKTVVEDSSYMCPVEFDADLVANEDLVDVKSEDEEVDVESVFQNAKTASETFGEESESPARCHSLHKRRRRKSIPALPISGLFSDDTLPMHQKSTKQKEWAMRANRIKEILGRETKNNLMFCRCRKIGLDFNVGSGRVKNLDMQLLTNYTLYEVYKFCSQLARSTLNFQLKLLETNFDFVCQENLQSYLYSKEKCLANQSHAEELLNTPIQFPEMYNVTEGEGQSHGNEMSQDPPGDDLSDDFPHCKRIGVNLWLPNGRPPRRRRSLRALTHGALLEIFGLARRLCGKPRDLLHDVLEHNFDVDLQDPASDEASGLRRWLNVNRFMIKKSFCVIKTNAWLAEAVSLKQCGAAASPEPPGSETPPLLPAPTPKRRTYDRCKEIGLDLNLSRKSPAKRKLDPALLTRAALFEVHRFVETECNRYVPALYEILDYNFDLSSQRHRRVEFAWSVAAQVLAMVRKGGRGGGYMGRVFQLPFEVEEGEICKGEEDEREIEAAGEGVAEEGVAEEGVAGEGVAFVRKLVPVDIDVVIQ
ncbi:uncharacterized protein [Eucyclogobius newberryi]|uniref:uncharacterized protein n=1 Tax=Eucyclogobius newberryi TaxID=166745 RepID=UPI003B58BD27